ISCARSSAIRLTTPKRFARRSVLVRADSVTIMVHEAAGASTQRRHACFVPRLPGACWSGPLGTTLPAHEIPVARVQQARGRLALELPAIEGADGHHADRAHRREQLLGGVQVLA